VDLLTNPVTRQKLPATIAAELRRQIAQSELKPGAQLPGHRELAAIYGVSVGSVREAISMLVSTGLIETRAGRGTFVADGGESARSPDAAERLLGRRDVEELIEAREVIEVELAALAARRATPEQLAALRRCVDRLEAAASNSHEYPDADVEFHLALAEAAGNRYLLRVMNDIRALLRRDMELGAEAAIRRFGDLRFSVESHRRLVGAIAARDSDAARRILAELVGRKRDFVLGLYAFAAGASSTE
jgi:GntR family transcriptional regulator, transcriptional repressor for pyruvate dehydrogenase complex